MKRVFIYFLLTFFSLGLGTTSKVFAQPAEESSPIEFSTQYGLSNYQYFRIYPHLEKAFKAQKQNNETVALKEFATAYKKAPKNNELGLLLANAYVYFGHFEKAKDVIENELKKQKDNQVLIAYLKQIEKAHFQEPVISNDLFSINEECKHKPTTACLAYVGQEAVNQGDLVLAQEQLKNKSFRKSDQGKALQRALIERADYLEEWGIVKTTAQQMSATGTLSAPQEKMWFEALLKLNEIKEIIKKQEQGQFTQADFQKEFFYYFQTHYPESKAASYFYQHVPLFNNANEERLWLDQAPNFIQNVADFYKQYQANYIINQAYINQHLVQKNSVSADIVPPVKDLDLITWELIKNGQAQRATQLLIDKFPFGTTPNKQELLIKRLIMLLEEHPQWITQTQVKRLQKPLAKQKLRLLQAKIPGVLDSCESIQHFFGDLSEQYSAEIWNLLATCFNTDKNQPGLALYAYEMAAKQSASNYQKKAMAYQAYQVEEYDTALAIWKEIPFDQLAQDDLKAAINTALAANDKHQLERWLVMAQKTDLTKSDFYWSKQAFLLETRDTEKSLEAINQAITINPKAEYYAMRARLYEKLEKKDKAVSDLEYALALEQDNSEYQAQLAYLLWSLNKVADSRQWMEQSLVENTYELNKFKHLSYANQRLDRVKDSQAYAEKVIDHYDDLNEYKELTHQQKQEHFNFRRLHEDVARKWTFTMNTTLGLNSDSVTAGSSRQGASPAHSFRSFNQIEADYRIGRNIFLQDDLLSVYSRLFSDTTNSDHVLPNKNPVWATGLRWKPFKDYTVFLAAEQQIPLSHHSKAEVLLRASASFLNGGDYSDEWHPNGKGWFAHNLYLDFAHYTRQNIHAWTADYRASWHQKLKEGQTVELYGRLQSNGVYNKHRAGPSSKHLSQRHFAGVGVRWNVWTGQSQYNAWPHKISLGLEYQRTIKQTNQPNDSRHHSFLTFGLHW